MPDEAKENLDAATKKDKSVWDYFVLCITEKYFNINGRARRKEYWSFILFQYIFSYVLNFIDTYLRFSGGSARGVELLIFLFGIALFIPGIAVLIRRLHDVNYSGWWVGMPMLFVFLLGLIFEYIKNLSIVSNIFGNNGYIDFGILGIVCIITVYLLFLFALLCIKSQMKTNKYGPVPEGVK